MLRVSLGQTHFYKRQSLFAHYANGLLHGYLRLIVDLHGAANLVRYAEELVKCAKAFRRLGLFDVSGVNTEPLIQKMQSSGTSDTASPSAAEIA